MGCAPLRVNIPWIRSSSDYPTISLDRDFAFVTLEQRSWIDSVLLKAGNDEIHLSRGQTFGPVLRSSVRVEPAETPFIATSNVSASGSLIQTTAQVNDFAAKLVFHSADFRPVNAPPVFFRQSTGLVVSASRLTAFVPRLAGVASLVENGGTDTVDISWNLVWINSSGVMKLWEFDTGSAVASGASDASGIDRGNGGGHFVLAKANATNALSAAVAILLRSFSQ